MTKNDFAKRLTEILEAQNKSERELSLDLGQHPGYINAICTEKSYPSMEAFFNMCDELNITPVEFFDDSCKYPSKINELLPYLKEINEEEFENISSIIKSLSKKQ